MARSDNHEVLLRVNNNFFIPICHIHDASEFSHRLRYLDAKIIAGPSTERYEVSPCFAKGKKTFQALRPDIVQKLKRARDMERWLLKSGVKSLKKWFPNRTGGEHYSGPRYACLIAWRNSTCNCCLYCPTKSFGFRGAGALAAHEAQLSSLIQPSSGSPLSSSVAAFLQSRYNFILVAKKRRKKGSNTILNQEVKPW